jgi:4-hydroxy-3-polyprenylbenzoate decarboxylase
MRESRSTTRSSRPSRRRRTTARQGHRADLPAAAEDADPDIVDYDLPAAGVFHNCAIVSIRKRYPKHAQKIMNAIWGAHLMSLTKLIVVVDEDCDVHDYQEVAFRAFGNVDYDRDLLLTQGPVDHLDHASYQQFWGGKAGLDATRKLPTEGYTRAGRGDDDGARGGRAGRQAVEGVRAVTSLAERPAGQVVPAAGGDRALGVRAAVRVPVGAGRDGSAGTGVHWVDLLLVTVAMVSGRTFAMAANRILDRHIDALNPRTANRELVTGAVSLRTAWTGAGSRCACCSWRPACSTRSAWRCRRSR